MITSIFGKIGGGKTYYTVKEEFLQELIHGTRVIVTNIALDLGAIAAYIQKNHPGIDPIDINDRVRIIDVDQMGQFFAHRHHGCDLDVPSLDDWRKGKNVCYDFDPVMGPEKDAKGNYLHPLRAVKYILDEVHVKFDSRGWQSQGPHVTFYNSQHRKLNDEIVFISQFPELVDKRLKMFSQEYVYAENHGLERLFTVFRAPAYFTVCSYLKERTGHNDVAQWKSRFTLDLAIACLYDTSAGVGIKGRKAPETRKKKGVSIFWGIGAICCAVGVLVWFLDYLPKKLAGATNVKPPASATGQTSAITTPSNEGRTTLPMREESPPPKALPPIAGDSPPKVPLYVTGISTDGVESRVQLSDGRMIKGSSGIIEKVNTSFVKFSSGEVLWVLPRARPQVLPEPKPKPAPNPETVTPVAEVPELTTT